MNKKDVCATQIAYVRFTEDDLADLDNQVRRVGASSRGAYILSLIHIFWRRMCAPTRSRGRIGSSALASMSASLTLRVPTVSYTHLDVYKRQGVLPEAGPGIGA